MLAGQALGVPCPWLKTAWASQQLLPHNMGGLPWAGDGDRNQGERKVLTSRTQCREREGVCPGGHPLPVENGFTARGTPRPKSFLVRSGVGVGGWRSSSVPAGQHPQVQSPGHQRLRALSLCPAPHPTQSLGPRPSTEPRPWQDDLQ